MSAKDFMEAAALQLSILASVMHITSRSQASATSEIFRAFCLFQVLAFQKIAFREPVERATSGWEEELVE
jgi:hypothetical protein